MPPALQERQTGLSAESADLLLVPDDGRRHDVAGPLAEGPAVARTPSDSSDSRSGRGSRPSSGRDPDSSSDADAPELSARERRRLRRQQQDRRESRDGLDDDLLGDDLAERLNDGVEDAEIEAHVDAEMASELKRLAAEEARRTDAAWATAYPNPPRTGDEGDVSELAGEEVHEDADDRRIARDRAEDERLRLERRRRRQQRRAAHLDDHEVASEQERREVRRQRRHRATGESERAASNMVGWSPRATMTEERAEFWRGVNLNLQRTGFHATRWFRLIDVWKATAAVGLLGVLMMVWMLLSMLSQPTGARAYEQARPDSLVTLDDPMAGYLPPEATQLAPSRPNWLLQPEPVAPVLQPPPITLPESYRPPEASYAPQPYPVQQMPPASELPTPLRIDFEFGSWQPRLGDRPQMLSSLDGRPPLDLSAPARRDGWRHGRPLPAAEPAPVAAYMNRPEVQLTARDLEGWDAIELDPAGRDRLSGRAHFEVRSQWPETTIEGEPTEATLVVQNVGDESVRTLVRLNVQPLERVIATDPEAAVVDGRQLVWLERDWPAGEQRAFTIRLMPDDRRIAATGRIEAVHAFTAYTPVSGDPITRPTPPAPELAGDLMPPFQPQPERSTLEIPEVAMPDVAMPDAALPEFDALPAFDPTARPRPQADDLAQWNSEPAASPGWNAEQPADVGWTPDPKPTAKPAPAVGLGEVAPWTPDGLPAATPPATEPITPWSPDDRSPDNRPPNDWSPEELAGPSQPATERPDGPVRSFGDLPEPAPLQTRDLSGWATDDLSGDGSFTPSAAGLQQPTTTIELAMRMTPTRTRGDEHPIIFEVRNTGAVVADDVQLVVTLPPCLEHPAGVELEVAAGSIATGSSYKTKLTAAAATLGEGTVKAVVRSANAAAREATPRLRVVAEGELRAEVDPVVTNGCECRVQ